MNSPNEGGLHRLVLHRHRAADADAVAHIHAMLAILCRITQWADEKKVSLFGNAPN